MKNIRFHVAQLILGAALQDSAARDQDQAISGKDA